MYYTVVYGPFKIVIPVAELVVLHKICRPSDYLVHSPKLAYLGQHAALDQYITNRYGKPFLQEILAGVKRQKASTQAEIIQQGLGSGAESSKKNVIPPRPFCQDRGNGAECAIEVEWHPRSLIHRTGALPGSTEV